MEYQISRNDRVFPVCRDFRLEEQKSSERQLELRTTVRDESRTLSDPLFHVHEIGSRAAEGFGSVHLLSLGGRDYEFAGRGRSSDVGVVVDTFPQER